MSLLMRRRAMMANDSWLPAGCVELEYLECTGTQYIDTGIKYTKGLIVSIKAVFYLKSTFDNFFGWTSLLKIQRNSNYVVAQINNAYYGNSLHSSTHPDTLVLDTHLNKFHFNDNILSIPDSTYNGNHTALLFMARDEYGNVDTPYYGYMRLYSLSINLVDDEINNFIPILDSTGTPCMYDTIGKQYYYNQGTGEFLYKIKE